MQPFSCGSVEYIAFVHIVNTVNSNLQGTEGFLRGRDTERDLAYSTNRISVPEGSRDREVPLYFVRRYTFFLGMAT